MSLWQNMVSYLPSLIFRDGVSVEGFREETRMHVAILFQLLNRVNAMPNRVEDTRRCFEFPRNKDS